MIVVTHHIKHQQTRHWDQRHQDPILQASILVASKHSSVTAGQMLRLFKQTCPAHRVDLVVVGCPKDLCHRQGAEEGHRPAPLSATTEHSATQTR